MGTKQKPSTGQQRLLRLSQREMQVLVLVLEGKSTKRIAEVLQLAPSSVDTYRSRLMAKLEVGNLPELVRFAIRNGVIEL